MDAEAVLLGLQHSCSPLDSVRSEAEATLKPLRVDTGRFLAAATVWSLGAFALCYVLIPTLMSLGGLRPFLLPWTLPGAVVSFIATWAGTAAILGLRGRAQGGLPVSTEALGQGDHLAAATVGGVLMWGLMHNILPGLMPFGQMSLAFLLLFGMANLLEMALFGVVLGSTAQDRRGAFAAGAAFQATLGTLTWLL